MALHPNIPSMLQESLLEMLLVAKYCIDFRKDEGVWSVPGCYGYPAALLLLSIVDSIGSYVEQGNVENHFKIIRNIDYYGLDLSDDEIRILYDNYRNLLAHNSVIANNVVLGISVENHPILQNQNGTYLLNLIPFYNANLKAINAFLNNPKVLIDNKTIKNIEKKSS